MGFNLIISTSIEFARLICKLYFKRNILGKFLTYSVFKKEIQSDPNLLPELDQYIIDIAKNAGLDNDKLNDLSLSFSEALSNSITHGNKNNISKKIRIEVLIDENKMTILIKDEGNGFDLKKIPDPTKPENILKDSGRGIHIMKSFLDNLSYNFTSEGTETILVINLK
ncbi:MAG: ATP-binding protein [Ignavibacteria bacterium]|nr:ATP-binding protein [Ignavibacteria bacterium]